MRTQSRIYRLLVTLASLGVAKVMFWLIPAIGQPTAIAPENDSTIAQSSPSTLVIGVSEIPPFAIKSGNDWDGIAVHLWREIARDLNLDYQLQEIESEQAVKQVENGTVDLVITAIATATDEKRVDFTASYYNTSLGIAQRRQRQLLEVVQAVFSQRFLRVVGWISILFLIIGVLIWVLERRNNPQFDKGVKRGIWTGFWWAGVTMTTIGYGDVTPKSVAGRILALIWMLMAMGITASLTAVITSVLAVNPSLEASQFPQDGWQKKLGTIPDSESAEYLRSERLVFQSFSTPLEGLQALQKGEIELFVFSAAHLKYLNRQSFQGTLKVSEAGIQARRYSFMLSEDSPLYETINQQILQETDESDWQTLKRRYLPESKSN